MREGNAPHPALGPPPEPTSGRDHAVQPQLASWGLTSVGRVREHNEDAHHVDAAAGLFLCADGMGGRAAGEVASRMAVEEFVSALSKPGWSRLKQRWLA